MYNIVWKLESFHILLLVVLCSTEDVPDLQILPPERLQVKYVGKSMMLTCRPQVRDAELITDFQWLDFNNRTIPRNEPSSPLLPMHTEQSQVENELKLYIPSITENMAGVYTCVANYASTNHLVASVMLEVNIAITWKDAPLKQNPIVGRDYKIRCEVQARPAPTVDWLKNGQPLPSDPRFVLESRGLLIRNVQETDDATYTCRASVVTTGEVESRHIKLEVHTPPKIFTTSEDTYEFVDGETATLSCKASGKPPPEYTWIKVSTKENLEITDRFHVNRQTGVLTVNRVEENDQTDYKCVAENPAGKVEQVIKVSVLIKPKIYEFFNMSISEHKEGKIICKATGRPPPIVTFRKFSHKEPFSIGSQAMDERITLDVQSNERGDETVATLYIDQLQRSDDGLYECIAKNKGAVSYKNGHLTVEFKPSFLYSKDQPPVFTWNNKPANLSCLAESIPNATIEWRLNNQIIISSPNLKIVGTGPQSNLIVTPVTPKYYSNFKCIATNIHGRDEHYIELKQAFAPGPITQAKVDLLTATTIRFGIVPPPTYGTMPLTAFTARYKREIDLSWINSKNRTWAVDSPYIIEELLPQKSYNFQFAAHNAVGMGPWSADQVQTMPSRSSPEEPKILSNTVEDTPIPSPHPEHFEVRWKIPADNGERIDYYLIKYCPVRKVNDEWNTVPDSCEEEQFSSFETTAYDLNHLKSDTHYKIELQAHNAMGYSHPAKIIVKTARGENTHEIEQRTTISSALIIGIVLVAVLVLLILIDLVCFCTYRAGILMCICEKLCGKQLKNNETKVGRDESEPLRALDDRNCVISSDRDRTVGPDYSERPRNYPGTFIGKNSAV